MTFFSRDFLEKKYIIKYMDNSIKMKSRAGKRSRKDKDKDKDGSKKAGKSGSKSLAMKSKSSAKSIDESSSKSKQAPAKPKSRANKKNISVSQVVKTVVDAVKKPLSKLSKREHKNVDVDVPFAENKSDGELMTSMKFFYENKRFIETFDDWKIYG